MSKMIPQYDTKLFTDIWEEVSDFLYDYQNVGIPTTISNGNATTLYYLLYARYGNNPIANYDEEQFKYKVFSIVFQYGPTWEKRLSVQNTLRGLTIEDLVGDGSFSELFGHQGAGTSTTTNNLTNRRVIDTDTSNTGTVRQQGNGTDENVKNNALNPSQAPAVNAYTPLTYINSQEANKLTSNQDNLRTDNLASTQDTTDTLTNTGTVGVVNSDNATNQTTRTLSVGKLKAYERLLELLDSDVTGDFLTKFRVCFKQFVLPERTWIYVTEVEEEDEDDGQ